MVDGSDRFQVGAHPRDGLETEWEVFVRDAETEPLRHVGSVSAPGAEVAYAQTRRLFDWATDVWLSPAPEVYRYSTYTLDENAEPAKSPSDDGERTEA